MATSTNSPTPEKVKHLLSSFLVSSNRCNPKEDDSRTAPSHCAINISSSVPEKDNGKKSTPRPLGRTNVLRSYESFQQRLDTFSSLTWFGKPAELSPLVCARYGWENVDTDMLCCVCCNAYLSGQLPSSTDVSAYEGYLEKLKKNLLSAHDKFCILAVKPCPESFCHVPCHDPATLTSMFIERASALNQIQDRLPCIDYDQLHHLDYNEGQGGAYCKRHLMPENNVSTEAVALAFTGWTCSAINKDVLLCSLCRRQIGLWNFSVNSAAVMTSDPITANDDDTDDIGEPEKKRQRLIVISKEKFDPIGEHKHWCPWLQPATLPVSPPLVQKQPTKDQAKSSLACIVALRITAPGLMDNNTGLAQTMKKSPMVEGLRWFRRVLKTWSSPLTRHLNEGDQTSQSP